MPSLRIGCSGWNYKAWRGTFYRRDLPQSEWLRRYAEVFDTVEINNSFYRLPEAATFRGWARQVPRGFLFAVKGSRFLTHLKRLKDPEEPVERLFSRAAALGKHYGPTLFQLPANFHCNLARLREFFEVLPRRHRIVMEFRHSSWYTSDVYRLMDRHGVALCLHDKRDSEVRAPRVGPFVYVRFHGTSGHYAGSYGGRALDRWARELSADLAAGRDVYAYFNNDPDASATRNARALRRRLSPVDVAGS